MSFGGNKKSKNELGSSKGWSLDFSAAPSQSAPATSSPSNNNNNNNSHEPQDTHASSATESGLEETGKSSLPAEDSLPENSLGTTLWGTPISYMQSSYTQQSSLPLPQTAPPVPTWGIPICSHAQSSQASFISSSTQTQSAPSPPPVHSVPMSCATSVTSWQSSYDGGPSIMPPPPPPQRPTQSSPQPPPPPPVHLPTRPLFPYKTVEVPKSALHALYGKEPRRRPIAASDFVTWHDGGPPHALQWSSCFICPLTAELFLTRPYEANRDCKEENGLIWYKKKTSAEHGAAACAYDCLTYRDFLSINPTVPPFKLLLAEGELAYGVEQAKTSLPSGAPSRVREEVEEQRAVVLAKRPDAPGAEDAWRARPGDSMPPEYFRNLYS